MEMLKLNETPVRTSRNFNINNIKLKDINIPADIREFNNVNITNNSSKINISSEVRDISLTYGVGEVLINQLKKNCNKKLNLEVGCLQNKEVIIDFNFDSDNDTLLEHIEVVIGENSKSTIILKYISSDNNEYWHNGLLKIHADKNSEVNIIIANLMNTKSNNFMSIENSLEENAKVNYTIIDFGGKNSITNYYSAIWKI